MTLINCPECGREISDKAAACPQCGCPVTKPDAVLRVSSRETEKTVRTIEKTGKAWKAWQLVGIVLMIIGFLSCIAELSERGMENNAGADSSLWPAFFSIGLLIWIIARVGAWWYHG